MALSTVVSASQGVGSGVALFSLKEIDVAELDVIAVVGAGNFGTVCKCRYTPTTPMSSPSGPSGPSSMSKKGGGGIWCAHKDLLPLSCEESGDVLRRQFQSEVKALGLIGGHPHVIRLLGHGVDPATDRLFMVFDWHDNKDLEYWTVKNDWCDLNWSRLCKILSQVMHHPPPPLLLLLLPLLRCITLPPRTSPLSC